MSKADQFGDLGQSKFELDLRRSNPDDAVSIKLDDDTEIKGTILDAAKIFPGTDYSEQPAYAPGDNDRLLKLDDGSILVISILPGDLLSMGTSIDNPSLGTGFAPPARTLWADPIAGEKRSKIKSLKIIPKQSE